MKNVIIIGGGTAGWLTALVVNKFHKNCDVTLIESSKIGILGAGEGSVPNFGAILKMLDINQQDFFHNTKSTIKNGLNFINWRGDNKSIKHLFHGENNFINNNNGFHFDARLVAGFFKNIALDRGVKHIDTMVNDIKKESDTVIEISLENGQVVFPDLLFDCTGLGRLVIGKTYNEKWVSYSDYLKVNSAIAYFLPQEKTFSYNSITQTNMISMKSGWMWQAPLQHRWGCGYVFNDSYITDEEAKKEIEDYIGKEIEVVKTFKYDAGYYERSWIGNSIAIGLSSTFLEPLESTSLMSIIMQLKRLIDIDFNDKYRENFNDFCKEVNLQNMLFVRYHYMCERNDTKFWSDYKSVKIPKELNNLINEDGSVKVKNNQELYSALKLKECELSQLTFFYNNYFTVHKKNSKKFENNII